MPELKPVAWMWEYRGFAMVTASDGQAAMLQKDPGNKVTPLYAIPEQVKAQWQAEAVRDFEAMLSSFPVTAEDWIDQRAQEAGDDKTSNQQP